MKKSLKAFMHGIIDYAGLFPPADLALDTAVHNYADYKDGEDAWMLSRFIIPASRLEELEPYAGDLFSAQSPCSFSVLGKGTETIDDFEAELEKVLAYCNDFCKAHGEAVATDVLEMKLPREVAFSHDVDLLQQLMDRTAMMLNRSSFTPSGIFYEGFFDESWRRDIEAVLQAISNHNESKEKENYGFAAFKMRCGGVEPAHFPSAEQVAFVLNKARVYDVAIKGTAGLHHPVRHYAESVQTKMHGFFNVFGGAMLGYAHDLDEKELIEILNEEDADNFSFTDEAFSWKEYSIETEDIGTLREVALLSYGSCSFDEPRDDLKQLNLF